MADKKKPGRFTIQFNLKDPQQQKAAILLDRQGRYKAHFIASAVLHYEQYAGEAVGNGVDAVKIKEVTIQSAPQVGNKTKTGAILGRK